VDWRRYKTLCDAPGTFSRWMLEQTLELARQQGVALPEIDEVLAGIPLPKPADHGGGSATDMFRVELAAARARTVHRLVGDAVREGLATPATASRGLGGFEAAWREYVAHVEKDASRWRNTQAGGGGVRRLEIESEVQGNVWKHLVAPGDTVAAGDVLIIIESMKMEIPVEAPAPGRVVDVLVACEQPVEESQVVVILETTE